MLKHPTLDQLHALGLHGMAKAFADLADAGQAKDIAHADWLALLLDRETSWRRDKRLTARLRAAKLRQQASVEDVDYRAARGLDRALFQMLSEGEWIDAHDKHATALQVDDPGRWTREWHDLSVLPHGKELPILDGDGGGGGVFAIKRRNESAVQNQIYGCCSHQMRLRW